MRSRADRDERRSRHRWWWSAGPPQVYLLDGRTDVAAGYSFRALSTTYSGPVIRARRASDNAEIDFAALYGFLDFSSISSWAAGDAFATTFYDQSGLGRHLTQSTAANQPKIIQASNAHPALLFDGSNDLMKTSAFTVNQPSALNIVYRRVANVGSFDYLIHLVVTTGSGEVYRDNAGSIDNALYAGTQLGSNGTSQPTGTRGAVGGTLNGASSLLEISGAQIASFSGAAGAGNGTGLTIGGTSTGTNPSNAEIQELALFNTAHTPTQLKADNAAMRAAWGF